MYRTLFFYRCQEMARLQSLRPIPPSSSVDSFKLTRKPEKLDKTKLINDIQNGIIQFINLSQKSIDDDFFLEIADAILKSKARVTHLYLSKNQITDRGVEKGIALFQEKSPLTLIDLSSNQIGMKGASFILGALGKNFNITSLNLFGNQAINDVLVEIKIPRYIQRNEQIKKEKENYGYYIACAALGISAEFPDSIIDIIFEYSNEASLPEAREFVKITMYKDAKEEAQKIKTTKLHQAIDKVLLKPNNVKSI